MNKQIGKESCYPNLEKGRSNYTNLSFHFKNMGLNYVLSGKLKT